MVERISLGSTTVKRSTRYWAHALAILIPGADILLVIAIPEDIIGLIGDKLVLVHSKCFQEGNSTAVCDYVEMVHCAIRVDSKESLHSETTRTAAICIFAPLWPGEQ